MLSHLTNCVRRRVGFLWLAVVFVFSWQAGAAPFDETWAFTQPDGTVIQVHGWGDEFYAQFEDEGGFSLVFDPTTASYKYAEISEDGTTLEATNLQAGVVDPETAGVTRHLRLPPETVMEQVRKRKASDVFEQERAQRWEEMKAARHNTGGFSVMSPPSSPTIGHKIGVTILVEFDDEPGTLPVEEIEAYLNGDNYTGYDCQGSVKEFFLDVSNDRLLYTNVLIPFYIRLPNPRAYYDDITKYCATQGSLLIRDALEELRKRPDYETNILPLLETASVDASGRIQALNVFYAGRMGGAWNYGLWPHMARGYIYEEITPQVSVNTYQISNIGSFLSLSVFCHENGHMICNFPDLYDYSGKSSGGIGTFCMMASTHAPNPQRVCAYLSLAAGWVDERPLTPGPLTLTTFDTFCYTWRRPGVSTEYYVIENRQQTGRDTKIPGSGIAVWHVDEKGSNSRPPSLNYNVTHNNFEVMLMQADGLWHLNVSSAGVSDDLFYYDNRAELYTGVFGRDTQPGSRWWDGSDSGLLLCDFSESAETMTLTALSQDFMVFFDAQGGKSKPAHEHYQTGELFSKLPVPERPGYCFETWTTAPDGEGEWITTDTVVSETHSKLYAKWRVKDPDIYYVDASRPDDSGDGLSWETACKTIQAAVDKAGSGDIVLATNGVYASGVQESPNGASRVTIERDITVKSVNGASVTVIQGSGDMLVQVRCAWMSAGRLEGFTLENGVCTNGYGYGGGVYAPTRIPVISRCVIRDCVAARGSASYYGTLENCLITENSTVPNPNSSGIGTTVYSRLVNCTVACNQSSGAHAGMYLGSAANTIFWENRTQSGNLADYANATSLDYCRISTMGSLGEGNITVDPLFLDAANGDFRLAANSPCIDAGNAAFDSGDLDMNGNRRVLGTDVDMGAYEFVLAETIVEFDAQGGDVERPARRYSTGTLFQTLPLPERDGYRFYGWHTEPEGQGSQITEATTVPSNAMLLYAWWKPIRTWYVDASRQDDSGDGLSWGTAFQTIQAAVDVADYPETVWVTNGVYAAGSKSTVNGASRVVITRNITVKSVNGPSVTFIQGGGTMRCVWISAGGLDGFTLENGKAASGGGVYGANVTPIVRNCILRNNTSTSSGGGNYGATLLNCQIVNNTASMDGGGSYGGNLSYCFVSENKATRMGGGAHSSKMTNCVITKNKAGGTYSGGGAYSGTLINCTVVENTAPSGAGVYSATCVNCIIWSNSKTTGETDNYGNATLTYCCTSSSTTSMLGGVYSDPQFINAAAGDYRLRRTSPCIDRGNSSINDLSVDFAGNPRVVGYAIDIGAYECDPDAPSKTFYVDALRPDDSGDGLSWETATQTIQAAIELADDYDTILVTNGVYASTRYHHPDIGDSRIRVFKAVTIKSVNGAEHTFIQGSLEEDAPIRCVYITAGSLEGFTFENGFAGISYGGGVYASDTTPKIRDCIIRNNRSLTAGGGAYRGTLINCMITNNIVSGAGHAHGGGSTGSTLINCVVARNIAEAAPGYYSYGGGVNSGILLNCTIANNTATRGGGSYSGVFTNCIIWGNNTSEGTSNNTFTGTFNYSCTSPKPSGTGNINVDPRFINVANGDYRLRRASPCIDAGDSSQNDLPFDIAGNPRVFGDAIDMGAYEHDPTAPSQTFHVDAARPDDSGDGLTWATALHTIQAAIDLADDYDTVLVTNGVYASGMYASTVGNNRIGLTKAVSIKSVNGAEHTIIQGSQDENAPLRCVYITDGVLEGFTIENGFPGIGNHGGGVYAPNTMPQIRNCIIRNNRIRTRGVVYAIMGGGAYNGTFINCVLTNNLVSGERSASGGGAYQSTLINCFLVQNTAAVASGYTSFGGGAYNGTLLNCTVANNTASSGGGTYSATLTNCIVWGNTTPAGVANNYNSGTITYSCVSPTATGTGNINVDPRFINVSNGDYRLRRTSPCIDTGNSSQNDLLFDIAGNPRVNGGAIDMGAYEHDPTAPSQTFHIDAARPDDSGDGLTWATALHTIQAAIDLADDYDTVLVTNGVYASGMYASTVGNNRIGLTKAVTVKSVNGAEHTFIQGSQDENAPLRGVYITDGSLEGFTIEKGLPGTNNNWHGGGVYALNITPQIQNCIIRNNRAMTYGGGTYYGTFTNCVITNNMASGANSPSGGGCYLSSLINSVVAKNTAVVPSGRTSLGGGAYNGTLLNCTVANNTATVGGGTYSATLTNCIIWSNTTPSGTSNNNYAGTVTYSCLSPTATGIGNINVDPRFINPAAGDYRLRHTSPCVDAGDSSQNNLPFDILGNPRIAGNAIDMGAYEHDPTAPSQTFHVDASRPDDRGDGLTWTTALRTIQTAIDLADDYDTVLVTNGVYASGMYVSTVGNNRLGLTKAVTVKSVNGAEHTFIQGSQDENAPLRGVYITDGSLEGFTIEKGLPGTNNNWHGGGVYALNITPQIQNCIRLVPKPASNWRASVLASRNRRVAA